MAQKIVLMGAGLIGREHAQLIRANPRTELVGIADVSEGAKAFADEFGARFFTDMREMLDATKPDGAIIALPNALHVEAALACVERKIPCLVEKPDRRYARGRHASRGGSGKGRRAGAGRSPPAPRPRHRQGPPTRRRRCARPPRRGQRIVDDRQARPLFRRRLAPAAGRRAAAHQSHPRHRLPALHLWRHRPGHGLHLQCGAVLRSGGYGKRQRPFRQRRARHAADERHDRLALQLGYGGRPGALFPAPAGKFLSSGRHQSGAVDPRHGYLAA